MPLPPPRTMAPSRGAWTRSARISSPPATPTCAAGWAWTRLSGTSGGDPSWARLRLLVELPRSPRRALGAAGDTVLAILPGHLSNQHDLPESTLITDDPDIAREDGALFLGAGNPEIGKGAEAVVAAGDGGALTLPHSAKHISTEDLLAKIRDQVPVAHGRIDATSSILRSHRAVLRLA